MRQSLRQRQQGMTFIGLLCILAMAGVIVYAGIRLVPVYLNYMNIVKTMEATASEVKDDNPNPEAIRNSLERHWEVTTISAVDYKDVEITKGENGVSLHVAYDDSEPFIANVSLAVHFDKTVKVR
jgi:Tfp pilus assembly protein PilE